MGNRLDFLSKLSWPESFKIPFFSSVQLYFDLGTSNTRIGIKNKGVVLKESTYLGINTRTKEAIFFGQEAKSILGKTPEFIKIFRPINNGVISDFDAEVALLNFFLKKAVSPFYHQGYIFKPPLNALTAFPLVSTEIEQKAVEEALNKAGCSSITMIEKPLATAAGCGIDVFSNQPHMIVDMGGGLIEISIIGSGGVISSKSIKNAGEAMDKIISNYVYLKHGIILGESAGEKLKTNILNFDGKDTLQLMRGKSLETGLPKSVKIKTDEIKEALLTSFTQINETLKELIEISPPETVEEVFNEGIYLTGGLSEIPGIDKYFSEELKVKIIIPKNNKDATINGLMELDKKPYILNKINIVKTS